MRRPHRWKLPYERAVRLQETLGRLVETGPLGFMPELAGGIDCAFSADERTVTAAAVVLKAAGRGAWELVETRIARRPVAFPYIPGLLSFREGPACMAAVARLRNMPQVFLVDGQGIAHPRRLGLASHLGVLLEKPTIGCAKSRLVGSYKPPGIRKGSISQLTDAGCTIGAVVRTRTGVKPLFVSIGNKVGLDEAVRITLACATRYRLPEPTRLAHCAVTRAKS
jgi:deoxyribonuclease V